MVWRYLFWWAYNHIYSLMDEDKKKKIRSQVRFDREVDTYDEDIKQAKSIGLLKSKEKSAKSEVIKDLYDIETEDDDDDDSIPIFLPGSRGKYRIDEKHFALMFLETFQGENENGEIVPKLSKVSRMLGIPRSTLAGWWRKRADLEAQQSALIQKGMRYVSTSLMVELIRMIQALSTVDYTAMLEKPREMKNFITLMNTLMNKVRLFSDKSTQNVAHKVALVVPELEDD